FDLHVPVTMVNTQQFQSAALGETSARVQARVLACRKQQQTRQGKSNALLSGRELDTVCTLDSEQQQLLEHAMDQLGLSARAYHRTLRVARTLADMEGKERLGLEHLTEALSYRNLDRRKSGQAI